MSEGIFKYNQRLYIAPNGNNFESIHKKQGVWKYFKKNRNSECRCNLCGAVFMQFGQSTTNMFKHLSTTHGEQVLGFYRVKKFEEGVFTDFIEDIVAAGYPAQIFLETLMRLFNCYQKDFNAIVESTGNKMTEARSRVSSVLQSMDIFTDKQQAKLVLKEHFPDLSEGARKSLLDQNFWMFREDTQIIEHFRKFGYNIHTQCQMKNIYSNMLLVTDSMKRAYHRFGDTMSINHIDRVFKKRSPRGFDEISCWFFTGSNQKLEIVLFGFALISQATVDSYKFIFSKFFRQMSGVHPLTICTPQLSKLQTTLQNLCPNTNIVTNWYHKLKYIKELLEQEREGEAILKSMCWMLQTPCQDQYTSIKAKITSKIADQLILKYGIDHENYKHCISKMFNAQQKCRKYRFMGYNIQTREYHEIERLIRSEFIYQQNLARLFIFALELDSKINYQFKSDSTKISYSQISQQNQFPKKLMQRLEKTWELQNQLIIQPLSPIQIKVYQKDCNKSKKIYFVKFLVQYDHWVCNCGYLGMTGLPCKHLVIVIQQYEGDIMYYINSRWKQYAAQEKRQQIKILDQVEDKQIYINQES